MPDRARPAAGKTAAGKTGKTARSSGQTKARGDRPADRAAVRRVSATGDGPADGASARVDVRKTYKLFIGGAFPRSESGRSYPAAGPDGAVLAHVAMASRKDARDAVVAARKAVAGWAGATAYNRGQVLYRVAELLQGRAAQFTAESVANEGISRAEAELAVTEAIDRWVWYAGWPDKVAQVTGAANPVAGPYFNFSVPEPTGVVAVLAPAAPGLLGLVSVLAPVIATGNTAVVVASESVPLPGRHAGRGARDLGRAARGGEHPDRPHRRARAGAGRAQGRERDRPDRGRPRPTGPSWRGWRPGT